MSDILERVKEELKNGISDMNANTDNVEVVISEDEMKAYIYIPNSEKTEITKKFLMDKLAANGVIYGIYEEMIDDIVENDIRGADVQVAEGKEKIDGTDGYIIYNFEPNPVRKPTLLEDGSVDYKNLGIIQNVDEGQVLAECILPEEEEDGMTVKGKKMPAYKGKREVLRKGKNVKFSEDGLSLISEIDGNVEMINGLVSVSNVRTISGDVCNATGNIYYKGDIWILGNVISGFSVEAVGSITIEGFVEAAYIKAGGDVLIKKGIQGAQKGKIVSNADVSCKFIEMAEVVAKGSIYTNAVINSQMESDHDIIVKGKKGYIIGGYTRALNRMEVTGLGNKWEAPTIIEIGFTDKKNQKLIDLAKKVESLNKDIQELLSMENTRTKKFKGKPINALDLMRLKIEKIAQRSTYNSEIEKLNELKEKSGVCKIEVENVLNMGVEIYIGNDVYKPRASLKEIKIMKGSNNSIVTMGL